MRYACTNCLTRVEQPGLCWKCARLAEVAGLPVYDSYTEQRYNDWNDREFTEPDEVFTRMLKERRMKSYARARKGAKHG